MKRWAIAIGIMCASCSSTTIEQTAGSSGGGAGGGGTVSSSPLVGTWDVVASGAVTSEAGTVSIGPTTLIVQIGAFTLFASTESGTPAITTAYETYPRDLDVDGTAGTLDLGEIPLALGGKWTVRGKNQDQCTASLAADAMSLECTDLVPPLEATLEEYDYTNRQQLTTGISTAMRTATSDSSFGDLGGQWTVKLPRDTCQIKIEGSTLDAQCSYTGPKDTVQAMLTLTFGDGFASGMSNLGEVSAKRR